MAKKTFFSPLKLFSLRRFQVLHSFSIVNVWAWVLLLVSTSMQSATAIFDADAIVASVMHYGNDFAQTASTLHRN